MKLTLLLMTVAMLHASANVTAQARVTLKSEQVEIAGVLTNIEKQTNYRFLYNNALKSIRQKIDIDVSDLAIEDALARIFTGTDLTYKMLENNLIVILSSAQAQQDLLIVGRVTGASGEVLPGVSVTVKGTTKGTTTDATGNFTVTAPSGSTLVFTYVGFVTQEIKIDSQTNINVQMKRTGSQMNEVVVVGYGTQKKIDVTGSVGHVNGAELTKQPVLTATQGIQGKVAGVQIISSGDPGSMPQVIIRGAGSILAGAGPLYVVDGIWTDDITNINSADIVAVDVLKDASACSIYGVRGANGVILITTRQGSGKMKMTYNGNFGVTQAAYIVPMANATQYINYRENALGLPVASTPYNTDWYNQVLRDGFYQNHNLSVSGGTPQEKYNLSAGYVTNQGIVIFNNYTRYTVRLNNEFTPASFLRIGTTASFANQAEQNVPTGLIGEDAYRAAPLIPAEINGKFGNTSAYQNVGNPVLDAQNTNDLSHNNRLQGNIYLEVKPISSLAIRTTFNDEANFSDDRAYTYEHPNDTTFFLTSGGSQGASRSNLNVNQDKYYRWVWSNTLNFSQYFGDHKLNILLGTESQEFYNTGFSASRYYVPPIESEWYIQDGDQNAQFNGSSVTKFRTNSYFGRIVYSYQDKYLFTGNFRADGSSVFATQNRWGYFPGVSAGWVLTKENFMQGQQVFQYLKVKGSWGELGNSLIPADASVVTVLNNIPYFYGSGTSASGATSGAIIPQIKDLNLKWEITQEADLGFEYSILKGHLEGEFDVYDKKVSKALIYVQVPGTFGSQPNPNSTIAAGDVLTNAAVIDNKGLEFSARWHDRINNTFSYNIGANISMNRNRVISLNGGLPYFAGNINGYFTTETKPGYPIGAFFMRKVLGVFQSASDVASYVGKNGQELQPTAQPGDLKYAFNANGVIDTAFVGAYAPKMFFGINGGINYGAFDLSVDIYGNVGNQVYNGKAQARVVSSDNLERSIATSFWTPQNHSSTQPSANIGDLPASSYFIASGTFYRLNNVTLGYTLQQKVLSRQKVFTSCRIFVNAQNAVTLKKYGGFTAELPGSAVSASTTAVGTPSTTDAGIELGTYPTTRVFAIGINLGL